MAGYIPGPDANFQAWQAIRDFGGDARGAALFVEKTTWSGIWE